MTQPWAPMLADVGARVPSKTRDQSNPGNDTPLNTFTAVTYPTDAEAQPLLDGATALVTSTIATITAPLYDLAKDAAAWRAAADIELAYPDRNADMDRIYPALDARAKTALDRLIEAADQAGQGAEASLPAWTMPPPVPWGDQYL